MLSKADFEAILADIKFTMFPSWKLSLRYDGNRPYLQVSDPDGRCNVTGKCLPWSGRKWMLSPHMTKTEVVFTAYKAFEAAVEHEFREAFRYRDVMISDPHRNVELLVEMASRANALDVRG